MSSSLAGSDVGLLEHYAPESVVRGALLLGGPLGAVFWQIIRNRINLEYFFLTIASRLGAYPRVEHL